MTNLTPDQSPEGEVESGIKTDAGITSILKQLLTAKLPPELTDESK